MSRQILQKQSKPSHRARVSHARSVAVHHSLHHQLCSAAIDKHHTKQQIQHATRIIAHVIRVEVGAYAVTTWLTHAPRRRTDDNRCRRDQFRTRHFQLRSTHQSEHKQAHTHTHTHTHTLSLSLSLSHSHTLSPIIVNRHAFRWRQSICFMQTRHTPLVAARPPHTLRNLTIRAQTRRWRPTTHTLISLSKQITRLYAVDATNALRPCALTVLFTAVE
jgi:hypothetical protein